MSADTPLLATKLHVPQARPNLVPRPRLIARLNEGLTRKLTLISAPAGYGKTTLLSEWITLDDADNDPARFWTYVIAALQAVRPSIGQSASDLLRTSQPQPLPRFARMARSPGRNDQPMNG